MKVLGSFRTSVIIKMSSSLDSGPFYSLRYGIFRDTPLFAIARERSRYLGYNAISRSVANTGYRERSEYRNE